MIDNTNFVDMYFDQIDKLGVSCELQTIETSYGLAQAICFGAEAKKPLILLPGAIGCALITLEASLELASDYYIYIVTEMFQTNSGLAADHPISDDQYAKWLYEIISRLDIQDVTLVGFSFGGFIAARSLIYNERNISEAYLIMPEGIIEPNYWRVMKGIISDLKQNGKLDKVTLYQHYLKEITTDSDRYGTEEQPNLWLLSSNRFLEGRTIQPLETMSIKTPVYLVAAEKDAVFPYKNLFERTGEVFPSFKGGILLKESKHIPNKQGVRKIIQFIKNQNK